MHIDINLSTVLWTLTIEFLFLTGLHWLWSTLYIQKSKNRWVTVVADQIIRRINTKKTLWRMNFRFFDDATFGIFLENAIQVLITTIFFLYIVFRLQLPGVILGTIVFGVVIGYAAWKLKNFAGILLYEILLTFMTIGNFAMMMISQGYFIGYDIIPGRETDPDIFVHGQYFVIALALTLHVWVIGIIRWYFWVGYGKIMYNKKVKP